MQLARCFDIGGTKIVAADVHGNGQCIEKARFTTPTESFKDFKQLIKTHCPEDKSPIGISVAAVIQPATGLVYSANIPCLSGRKLAVELSRSLNRDVFVINDANAFALAEATFGTAREHHVVLAIILGTGVGGGIVVNGNILSSPSGTTGEWGHGPASAARTSAALPRLQCHCGQKQCIDALGSARGLERLYAHICSAQLNCEQVIDAWYNGDCSASRAIDVWLDIVGGALANVVNFLGPSIVVVGGGLANANKLIDRLDQEVIARSLSQYNSPLLHAAVNGPEQGLLGAAVHCRIQSNQ